MPNLLANAFSYGDFLKRKVGGLLSDPMATLEQMAGQLSDDQRTNGENMANAYPMAGDKSVLVTPAGKAKAQGLLADYGAQSGMAGMIAPTYRGEHMAPMKGEGSAPLHDLAQIYPDDIYSSKAAQYYGHFGDARDNEAVSLMQAAKGRPNMPVTMYRAVPDLTSGVGKEIKAIRKTIDYKDRFGFFPMKDDLSSSFRAKYENSGMSYDDIQAKAYEDMLGKITSLSETLKKPPPINNGDWVTLSKAYAKEHGEGALNGNYKIVSKKVPARKLFTDANSIQEFGYDESGKISPALLAAMGIGGGAALSNDDIRNKLRGLLGK